MEKQLVVFELANEHYGVNIAAVESIIKMQTITAVPHAPHYVTGVTNLRGSVLPVIENSRIVVVTLGDIKVGMTVDGVSEVLSVPEDVIEPTPPMVSTVDSSFITGIARLEGRLVILLDLGKVLSLDEQASLVNLPEPA